MISADSEIGTQQEIDVEFRDGIIIAVGRDLPAPGAEVIQGNDMITMPGFVETHFHLWSTIGKSFLGNGFEYFDAKWATCEFYQPEDYYHSVRLGLMQSLRSGMTTVHNWCHNVLSPAHVDAELRAHREIPIRARYSYGFRDQSGHDTPLDFADIDRVRSEWFQAEEPFASRVHLGVNLRGTSSWEVFAHDYREARERGLPVSVHSGQGPEQVRPAAEMLKRSLLHADTLLCHGLPFDRDDREAMRLTGSCMSISPHSEFRGDSGGQFHRQLMQLASEGVTIALSIDAASLAPIDMFECMRIIWNLGVPWQGTETAALEKLSFAEVISMATLNGARALGLEDSTGSVTPGKRADLVLIRRSSLNMAPVWDPEAAVVLYGSPSDVDTVFVDGVPIMRSGEFVSGPDPTEAIAAAQESAAGVLRRSGLVDRH